MRGLWSTSSFIQKDRKWSLETTFSLVILSKEFAITSEFLIWFLFVWLVKSESEPLTREYFLSNKFLVLADVSEKMNASALIETRQTFPSRRIREAIRIWWLLRSGQKLRALMNMLESILMRILATYFWQTKRIIIIIGVNLFSSSNFTRENWREWI